MLRATQTPDQAQEMQKQLAAANRMKTTFRGPAPPVNDTNHTLLLLLLVLLLVLFLLVVLISIVGQPAS